MSVTCFGLCSLIAIVWRQYYVWENAKRARYFKTQKLSSDSDAVRRLGADGGEEDQTDLQNVLFRYHPLFGSDLSVR